MKEIILTVQPSGAKKNNLWRLGVPYKDSLDIFKERGVEVIVVLGKFEAKSKTTCGPPLKKGFDFNSKIINSWIIERGFQQYPARKPTKLLFKYNETLKTLTFIKKKCNFYHPNQIIIINSLKSPH